MRGRFWKKGLAFLVLVPAMLALMSVLVMLLWNALVPALFAGPVVSFWQAAGLLLLSRILFVGFRPGRAGWRHHGWRQRWHAMSPEERARLRDGFQRWEQGEHAGRDGFGRGFCGRSARSREPSGAAVDGGRHETSPSPRENSVDPGTGAAV